MLVVWSPSSAATGPACKVSRAVDSTRVQIVITTQRNGRNFWSSSKSTAQNGSPVHRWAQPSPVHAGKQQRRSGRLTSSDSSSPPWLLLCCWFAGDPLRPSPAPAPHLGSLAVSSGSPLESLPWLSVSAAAMVYQRPRLWSWLLLIRSPPRWYLWHL